MGYACPVCEDPQSDAGHLANHLAFTAITSGGDHEEWLDEHVPGWGELGKSELADEVTSEAEETEFPQVFEESGLDDPHDHGQHQRGQHGQRDHGSPDQALADHGVDPSAARARGSGDLDDEARSIMEEARELTEAMRDDGDEGDSDNEAESGDGGDAGESGDDESEAETE